MKLNKYESQHVIPGSIENHQQNVVAYRKYNLIQRGSINSNFKKIRYWFLQVKSTTSGWDDKLFILNKKFCAKFGDSLAIYNELYSYQMRKNTTLKMIIKLPYQLISLKIYSDKNALHNKIIKKF